MPPKPKKPAKGDHAPKALSQNQQRGKSNAGTKQPRKNVRPKENERPRKSPAKHNRRPKPAPNLQQESFSLSGNEEEIQLSNIFVKKLQRESPKELKRRRKPAKGKNVNRKLRDDSELGRSVNIGRPSPMSPTRELHRSLKLGRRTKPLAKNDWTPPTSPSTDQKFLSSSESDRKPKKSVRRRKQKSSESEDLPRYSSVGDARRRRIPIESDKELTKSPKKRNQRRKNSANGVIRAKPSLGDGEKQVSWSVHNKGPEISLGTDRPIKPMVARVRKTKPNVDDMRNKKHSRGHSKPTVPVRVEGKDRRQEYKPKKRRPPKKEIEFESPTSSSEESFSRAMPMPEYDQSFFRMSDDDDETEYSTDYYEHDEPAASSESEPELTRRKKKGGVFKRLFRFLRKNKET